MNDIFNRNVIDSFQGEYSFLSNFFLCDVDYDGQTWPSAEHAYQAAKCARVEDYELFLGPAMTPGHAKRAGKRVAKWEKWNDIKLHTMEKIIAAKFRFVNSDLSQKLLETGDSILIEGNSWGDTYWGVCDGVGTNYLGNILMRRRELLRSRL